LEEDEESSFKRASALLEENPDLLHAKDVDGNTALNYACFGGNHQTVLMLLRKGAHINVANTDVSFSAYPHPPSRRLSQAISLRCTPPLTHKLDPKYTLFVPF